MVLNHLLSGMACPSALEIEEAGVTLTATGQVVGIEAGEVGFCYFLKNFVGQIQGLSLFPAAAAAGGFELF